MLKKTHYAQRAAKKFLRNTPFSTPDEAIRAGYRTESQWQDFMKGTTWLFWSQNGQRARRKVKSRHPMKRVRKQRKLTKNGQILVQNAPIDQKRRNLDALALEKRAQEWGGIGGNTQSRIDRQAREAYRLYLDFARHAIAGDFKRWLSRHSGIEATTCQRRLLAGIALELGLTNRNQAGLLAEMRERKSRPAPVKP